MVDNIKLILGISGNTYDSLIALLIEQCTEFAVDYTHADEDDLGNIITQMVVERFNKIGSEGISGKSYSGISETALQDYSSAVYRMLISKRKLRTV